MKKISIELLGVIFTIISLPSIARELENISLNSSKINAGKPVEIIVDLKNTELDSSKNQAAASILGVGSTTNSEAKVNLPCAVQIDFGDGSYDHLRIDGDTQSLKINHTFIKPGSYSLNVDGKTMIRGLKSVFGCSGNALKTTANVLSEEVASKHEETNNQNSPNNFSKTSKAETSGLSTKELFKKGIVAYQTNNYQDAQSLLSTGLKSKPSDAIANLYLGLSLKELNQYELATDALKIAMKGKLSKDNRKMAKQAIADIKMLSNKAANEVSNSPVTQTSADEKNNVALTKDKSTENTKSSEAKENNQNWISDSKGCKVFNPAPTPGESITWSGECAKGFANGYGVVTWMPVGERDEGNYINGKKNGKGTIKSPQGSYEGDFVQDIIEGKGIYKYANGEIYEGDYINNHKNGHGKYSFITGDSYEGIFVNDDITGKGIIKFKNGDLYDGYFVKGERTGKGIYKWKNGGRYDGDVYEGEFVKGEITGNGTYTFNNGRRKVGYFKKSELFNGNEYDVNGNILVTFANGSITQQAKAETEAYDSSAASSDVMFDIISGVTGIVVQNKINHDAKRQRQAAAQQQAQQQAYQQAQAEQQAYDNSRVQLDAQRAQQAQANTEIHVGPVSSNSASNNNTRYATNNSQTTTQTSRPQAPCTSTTTYNDRKGTAYSEIFMRGNTIFAKVIPNTSYGADCSISLILDGNSRTLYLNNIPGNIYSEAIVGNYPGAAENARWDNVYSTCQLSSFERESRETKRKQEIMQCEFNRRR